MRRILLIGFMGSGKSTLGRELAKKLGYTFLETDQMIEEMEGQSISNIFLEKGEGYFRQKEQDLMKHLQLVDECVIATGGGMPCFNKSIESLNQLGMTLWLDEDEPILVERLEREKEHRPLLSSSKNLQGKIHELLEERKSSYAQAQYQIKNPTLNKLLQIVNLAWV